MKMLQTMTRSQFRNRPCSIAYEQSKYEVHMCGYHHTSSASNTGCGCSKTAISAQTQIYMLKCSCTCYKTAHGIDIDIAYNPEAREITRTVDIGMS